MVKRCMSSKARAAESRGRDSEPSAIQILTRRRIGSVHIGRVDAPAVCWRLQGGPELQDAERGDGAFVQGTSRGNTPTKPAGRGLEARAAQRRQAAQQVVGVL